MVKLPHWPHSNERSNIIPGLGTTLLLLAELGNPHLKLPPVVHIAGTNGKGSTQAFLKAIFEDANYKVHTYTSPHLIRFNERIILAGSEIADDMLYSIIEEVRYAAENINVKPSFFEATTIAAFIAFSRIAADVLILETGMGGKFDSTNVIPDPILTVITTISFDHVEHLGNSIAAIAAQKAGIIKRNATCVVSQQYDEAFEVIDRHATELNVNIEAFEYDWIVEKEQDGLVFKNKQHEIFAPKISLKGDHQIINAGNAIAASLFAPGFNISVTNIINGIANAFWPARLQKLLDGELTKLVPENWEIIVDGAHNDSGAHILGHWISQNNNLPTYVIFGMSKKRDVVSFVKHLGNSYIKLFTVPIDAEPLSYSSEYITDTLKEVNIDSTACSSLYEAINQIVEIENKAARILIAGSLFLAADVIDQNQKKRTKT